MVDFSIPFNKITFSIFPDNTVFIEDSHNYDATYQYAVFEWFENSEGEMVCQNVHVSGPNTPWKTDKLNDGHLTYYKFVVPKQADTVTGDFCWTNTDGKIDLKHKNEDTSWTSISLSEAFNLIHNSSSTNNGNNECLWYPGADMFLLGNIKECLVKLQTEYINNVMYNKCNELVVDKRNFLHAALEVIKYLIIKSDYSGAQNILDSLSRSGCEFCRDNYNNIIGCNCGGA